jgi:hypothetical protein
VPSAARNKQWQMLVNCGYQSHAINMIEQVLPEI